MKIYERKGGGTGGKDPIEMHGMSLGLSRSFLPGKLDSN